jgi:hypothetical protein
MTGENENAARVSRAVIAALRPLEWASDVDLAHGLVIALEPVVHALNAEARHDLARQLSGDEPCE